MTIALGRAHGPSDHDQYSTIRLGVRGHHAVPACSDAHQIALLKSSMPFPRRGKFSKNETAIKSCPAAVLFWRPGRRLGEGTVRLRAAGRLGEKMRYMLTINGQPREVDV